MGAAAALLAISLLVAKSSCAENMAEEPGRVSLPPTPSEVQLPIAIPDANDVFKLMAMYKSEIKRLTAELDESERRAKSAPAPVALTPAPPPKQDAHGVQTSEPCGNRTQQMSSETAACHFLEVRRMLFALVEVLSWGLGSAPTLRRVRTLRCLWQKLRWRNDRQATPPSRGVVYVVSLRGKAEMYGAGQARHPSCS